MLGGNHQGDNQKDTVAMPALAAMVAVSIGMVVLLFILYINLLVQAIRILSGIPAVLALFGLIVLGLVALITPISVGAWYRRNVDARKVLARFLLVSGVQGVLLFLSELFRRWLLGRIGPGMAEATLGFWNDVALVAGLVIGVGGLVAGALIRRRYRQSLKRR